MNRREELERAIAIAKSAGAIAALYFRSDRLDAQDKGWRDVITAADHASEAHVRERLLQQFPGDGVVGEEGTNTASQNGRCWYVDPLDGTLNFSRGLPLWCFSMALFESGRPVTGVIHDPLRGETYAASEGLGAWRGEQPVTTSGVAEMSRALVHVTVDFVDGSLRAGLEDLRAIAPVVLRTRNIGSAALALAYVAAGHLDALLHRRAYAWDYGAGVVLIREAGGVVTDIDGSEYRAETETLLAAASPALHSGLLTMVRDSRTTPLE